MKHGLALLLIAVGCGSDRIDTVGGKLLVSPPELRWERVFVGFPLDRAIELRNAGRAPLVVRLETAPPFSSPEAVRLAGGEVRRLQVTFDPGEAGDFTAELEVTTKGQDAILVPLSGHAEVAPDCASDDPCSTSQLDPEQGCVVTRLPDDSPCGDECATGAVCRDGQCVGANLACGGDRCQVCVKGVGCQAIDPVTSCPSDPENPCQVPVCLPEVGCDTMPRADGSPCGEPSCTAELYKVCSGGVCENREPKDGFRCGTKTPCQDYGICEGITCKSGEVHALDTAFQIRVSESVTLHFDGVANDAGTIYWSECSGERCQLVAVNRDGLPFIREEMFRAPHADRLVGSLVLVGELLISTLRPGYVEAYSSETGAPVWSHPLAPDLPDELAKAVLTTGPAPAAADGVVAVTVLASRGVLGFDPLGSFLVALRLSNGSPVFAVAFEGALAGPVSDGRGSFYVTEDVNGGELVAVRGDGEVAWRKQASFASPLAAVQGRVFHPTGGIFDTATGARVGELPFHLGTDSEDVLVWSGFAYAYGYPYADGALGRYPQLDRPTLFRASVETLDKPDWSRTLDVVTVGSRSRPVLTRRGTVLVTSNDKPSFCTGQSRLREWGDATTALLDCPLPGAGFAGTALLLKGRYVVVDTCTSTITSLVLDDEDAEPPMYEAPSRGWVAPGGNPGRSQAPRQ